jgi:pimeloyl-ACP methyl ester carboxylesterase
MGIRRLPRGGPQQLESAAGRVLDGSYAASRWLAASAKLGRWRWWTRCRRTTGGRTRRDEAIATARTSGVAPIAEAMLPKLLGPLSQGNRDLTERVRRIMMRQKPETVVADLTAMRDRADARTWLPEIAIPTLALVGEQDALTPPADAAAMAAAIPGARLVTVPGAGHLAPMERPGAVAGALSDFFAAALGG